LVDTVNMNAYSDALVVLGTAGILVPLLRKWNLNPILGYLGAGALLGPLGLRVLLGNWPGLYWCTISNAHSVEGIAELGIVFLLFRIGLELSLKRLRRMGALVGGLGGLQVILTATLLASVLALTGQGPTTSIVVGLSLSLSSTAIVLEILSKQGRMSAAVGRASFAVLLAQDLAVIPLLMYISMGNTGTGGSAYTTLLLTLGQTAATLLAIVFGARLFMRPLFRLVAAAHSSELFIAAVLFVVVAAAVVAHQSGLSMALGAFVAGLLLAETEYRKAIQAVADPFKGLLLGIFFFTIGMGIDFRELVREPVRLAIAVLGLILLKALVLTGLGRLFRLPWHTAAEMGLLLGPGGEFAFVGLGMAAGLGRIDEGTASFWLATTSVTMALIGKNVIVVGYGRVGKVVCDFLKEHEIAYIATDNDPQVILHDRQEGAEVYYGDAANPELLKACGLAEATGVVVTINAREATDAIVAMVRQLRPHVPIITRARDASHARHLYETGASYAVPETIEASLQLSEAALVGIGVPAAEAIASVHTKRDAYRNEMLRARKDLQPQAE
jgi:CPA2 family monovalent cation:H+ antiporter-2